MNMARCGHMAIVLANTHRIITKLKAHGFTAEQATGITEVFEEVDLSSLTTKEDLHTQTADLIKWFIAILIAQTALVVSLIELLD